MDVTQRANEISRHFSTDIDAGCKGALVYPSSSVTDINEGHISQPVLDKAVVRPIRIGVIPHKGTACVDAEDPGRYRSGYGNLSNAGTLTNETLSKSILIVEVSNDGAAVVDRGNVYVSRYRPGRGREGGDISVGVAVIQTTLPQSILKEPSNLTVGIDPRAIEEEVIGWCESHGRT